VKGTGAGGAVTIADLRDTWSEDVFQGHVIALAKAYGWRVAHFRPVQVKRRDGSTHWQTPVQADGAGFFDLVLAKDGRVLFVELKAASGTLEPEQRRWRDAVEPGDSAAWHRWFCWRPADWDEIDEMLRGGA
jgi:hypothetical protein